LRNTGFELKLTVVIPTYDEAQNITNLAAALFSLPVPDLRLLVVDDNSPDGTAQVVQSLKDRHPGRVSLLVRPGKMGLGSAYITGFKEAIKGGAEAVAQMDADFSHPPEKLLELLETLSSCDVAMGSRYIPGGSVDLNWPRWRKGLSSFGNLYARLILRLPVKDATGGFRVWQRSSLLKMPLDRVRSNGYAFQVEMAYIAHRLGLYFQEVPFYFADRQWGQSKMSFNIQVEAAIRVWQLLLEYRDLKPGEVPTRPANSTSFIAGGKPTKM
jgi:dolichol-phosphate mannosyltransferase